MFVIIPENISVSNTNISGTSQQQEDIGVPNPDPAVWTARSFSLREETLASDTGIYTYTLPSDSVVVTNPNGSLFISFSNLLSQVNVYFNLTSSSTTAKFSDIYRALNPVLQNIAPTDAEYPLLPTAVLPNTRTEALAASTTIRSQYAKLYLDFLFRGFSLPVLQELGVGQTVRVNTPWVRTRTRNVSAFTDAQPSVVTGRNGTLTFRIFSRTRFDSIGFVSTTCSAIRIEEFVGKKITNAVVTDPGVSSDYTIRGLDVPPQASGSRAYIVDVTITGVDGGLTTIGQVIAGNELQIGISDENSFRLDGVDFSEVERNDFGTLRTTLRNATYNMKLSARIERTDTAKIRALLTSLRGGQDALFYAVPETEYGSFIYGFVSDFFIQYEKNTDDKSLVTVTIAGIV